MECFSKFLFSIQRGFQEKEKEVSLNDSLEETVETEEKEIQKNDEEALKEKEFFVAKIKIAETTIEKANEELIQIQTKANNLEEKYERLDYDIAEKDKIISKKEAELCHLNGLHVIEIKKSMEKEKEIKILQEKVK